MFANASKELDPALLSARKHPLLDTSVLHEAGTHEMSSAHRHSLAASCQESLPCSINLLLEVILEAAKRYLLAAAGLVSRI